MINRLLRSTIATSSAAVLIRPSQQRSRRVWVIEGNDSGCIRLRNDWHLNIVQSVELHNTNDGLRLKTSTSKYQYQRDNDPETEHWVFRYEYIRTPERGYTHPTAHLHIKGDLSESGALPNKTPLERVHFVTHRVSIEAVIRISIEAVIRILIEEFHVPTALSDKAYWRAALAASEKEFLDRAHRAESGPAE